MISLACWPRSALCPARRPQRDGPGLRGDGRDERFAQIDLQATALAGLALIVALIVAWLVATARGQSGRPYGWLLAIVGLAYLLAVAWFRWRG